MKSEKSVLRESLAPFMAWSEESGQILLIIADNDHWVELSGLRDWLVEHENKVSLESVDFYLFPKKKILF